LAFQASGTSTIHGLPVSGFVIVGPRRVSVTRISVEGSCPGISLMRWSSFRCICSSGVTSVTLVGDSPAMLNAVVERLLSTTLRPPSSM
jgi:hypothetical protein